MFRRILLASCLLLFLLGISCSDDNPVNSDSIKGSGDRITEIRTVSPFYSVDFTSVGDVTITIGAEQAVSITVDDNIMQYITTTVGRDGMLTIGSTPNVNISEFELDVDLTMPILTSATLSGVGNIASTSLFQESIVSANLTGTGNIVLNLDVDLLNTLLAGTGNIVYSGTANMHQFTHTGSGNMVGFDLVTDTTNINLSGQGNCQVYVYEYLSVNLSGIGTASYMGQPSMNINITGQGSIIDAN